MAVRDRIVAVVLAAAVLLGMAAWQAVTPWLGIAVVITGVVAACLVYRFDGRRDADAGADDSDVHEPEPRTRQEGRVSTPRRAAGRP